MRNGFGKEYDFSGKLNFEGEYLYNHKLKGKLYIKEKNQNMKENFYSIKNGMEKDMMKMEI